MKTRIGDWYREQRRLTAFLREHKDEYYPRAKKLAIAYALTVVAIGILVLTSIHISTTYESALLAYWVGVFYGAVFTFGGWSIRSIFRTAREIQTEIQMKHRYWTSISP